MITRMKHDTRYIQNIYTSLILFGSLMLLMMALGLSSCAPDDSIGPSSKGSTDSTIVRLTFNINDGTQTRSITAANENTVSDITVLAFDAGGSLIGSKYVFPVSSTPVDVPVTARSATGCTIYAIANIGHDGYFAGVNTIDQLNKMSTTITSPSVLESAGSIAGSNGALMVGKATANITTGGVNQFPITLYHQCGKVSFTITPASGVTITGYQLCNVPLSSYITDSHVSPSAPPPVETGNYGNFDAVSNPNPASLSKTYYIYENLCGSNSNVTAEAFRNSSNAPSTASYLLVNAKSNSWISTYRIYLGGVTNVATPATDLTNFNIYRNLNYQCNISLGASGGNGDARVTYTATPTSGRPNMYMGDATVGNYLYNDGTNGPTFKSGQTVGVIFSSELTLAQYSAGCRHGRVLAIKNANASTAGNWGSNSPYTDHSSTGHPYVSNFKTIFGDVSSGYDAMSANSSYIAINSNYAWYYCKTYNDGVANKTFVNAPNNVGVWYLPSAGDWWDIMENLGTWTADQKAVLTTMRSSTTAIGNTVIQGLDGTYFSALKSKLNVAGGDPIMPGSGVYYFWCASETGSTTAVRIFFDSSYVIFTDNNKAANFYYRAVLAF